MCIQNRFVVSTSSVTLDHADDTAFTDNTFTALQGGGG